MPVTSPPFLHQSSHSAPCPDAISPAAAADAAGNYVVVWQSWEDAGDGSDFGIYARLFGPDGTPLDLNGNGIDDDTLLVNTVTAGSQSAPAVATDAAGNFVVAWQAALQDGSGTGIFARRFDRAAGQWATPAEFQVNQTAAGDQAAPAVATDAAGNYIIVWQGPDDDGVADPTPEGNGIYGRRYAADGTAMPEGEFRINAVADYEQFAPTVAMNAAGQFVVAWVSDHNIVDDPADTEKSIFARWFGADGQPLGTEEFLVHEGYVKDAQEHPSLGLDAQGNFVVAWQSINQEKNQDGVGSSRGVYARRFVVDPDIGTVQPQGSAFRVNETTDGPQRFPTVGMNDDGNFVVTWQSIRQDASSWAVLARQYRPDGTPEGGEALVNLATSGPQILPVAAVAGTNDFAIFWSGQGTDHVEGVWGRLYQYQNEPPVNTVPGPQTLTVANSLLFSQANGNAIRVADPDAGTGDVTVTLQVDAGTLVYAIGYGVTATGYNTPTLVLTGSLDGLNKTLDTLFYLPAAAGVATLTVTTSDNGNTGGGPALTDVDTVALTVCRWRATSTSPRPSPSRSRARRSSRRSRSRSTTRPGTPSGSATSTPGSASWRSGSRSPPGCSTSAPPSG